MSTSVTYKGHCYCGSIEYAIVMEEDASPLFPSCYCHCDSCRRSHAAPLYHVVCIDKSKQFKFIKGEEFVQKYMKPNAPNGITRCFCNHCGTKIYNLFDPKSTVFSSASVKEPMVFFPDTLCKEDRRNLPDSFKPKFHNRPEECVLDLELIKNINERGIKSENPDFKDKREKDSKD